MHENLMIVPNATGEYNAYGEEGGQTSN